MRPKPAELEMQLGSVFDPRNPFSFGEIMRLDESESFPTAQVAQLQQLDQHLTMFPSALGGDLQNYGQLIEPIKCIGRRDLTTLIAQGKNFLGSLPVLLFGQPQQQIAAQKILRAGGQISLAVTEHESGSDLLATGTTATRTATGWRLDGNKWLINNIETSSLCSVLAMAGPENGPKRLSLFAVPLSLQSSKVSFGHKIPTVGVRGMRMNSIEFSGLEIGQDSILQKEGLGFSQILTTFQVSRGLCSVLGLGAVETALRVVTEFVLRRELYGQGLSENTVVQDKLSELHLHYLSLEIVARFATRALTTLPEEMSTISAFTKFYLPLMSEWIVAELAVILGARSYLRDTWCSGIFQKIKRDIALVSIFDGSSQVNLYILANQLPALLASASDLSSRSPRSAQDLLATFDSQVEIGFPDFSRFRLTNRGDFSLFTVLGSLNLEAELGLWRDWLMGELKLLKTSLKDFSEQPARFIQAQKFCFLSTAACVLLNQKRGTKLSDESFQSLMLLLRGKISGPNLSIRTTLPAALFQQLRHRVEKDLNLGLESYVIAPWYQQPKEIDFE